MWNYLKIYDILLYMIEVRFITSTYSLSLRCFGIFTQLNEKTDYGSYLLKFFTGNNNQSVSYLKSSQVLSD